MKSIWLKLGVVNSIVLLSSVANGQIATLGADPGTSRVSQASCGCGGGGGCGGGDCDWTSGTVWGTSCMESCSVPCGVRHGLFAPCPNPCQGTFLGDVLMDLTCAVGTGVTNVLGCIFPCSPCACGSAMYETDCGCDMMAGDAGCGCDSCMSANSMLAPTVETMPLQPTPQPATIQADPFKDDPPLAPQAMRLRGTKRATMAQSRRVAQTTYHEPVVKKGAVQKASAGSKHNLTRQRATNSHVNRHYHHRPGTALRGAVDGEI